MFCCFVELLLSQQPQHDLLLFLPFFLLTLWCHSPMSSEGSQGSVGFVKMSNVQGETLRVSALPRFSDMLCRIQSSSSFKPLLYLLSFSVSTCINIFYVLPWSFFLPSFPLFVIFKEEIFISIVAPTHFSYFFFLNKT